jgi:hypothetical protein
MFWLLTLLTPFVILIALVLGGIAWAQAAGRMDVVLRINALDIDITHKRAALAYFEGVDDQVSLLRTLRDHVIAPFVLLIPLMRLPREADDLPDSLAYWRNNVGINGDGYGWCDADGRWHQCAVEKEPPDVTAVRYGDPDYGGDAYYAPGHHPRSWYARWIWLAWRNVATGRQQEIGPLIQTRPILLAGSTMDNVYEPGFALYWNGAAGDDAAYQWRSVNRWGPLALWCNVGAKLGVAYSYPEVMPCRAMLTATWRALRFASDSSLVN